MYINKTTLPLAIKIMKFIYENSPFSHLIFYVIHASLCTTGNVNISSDGENFLRKNQETLYTIYCILQQGYIFEFIPFLNLDTIAKYIYIQ